MDIRKSLLLDIDEVKLSHDGVCEFYWPVLPTEVDLFSKQLLKSIVSVIRKGEVEKVSGVNEAIILGVYFAQEAAMVYQAQLLIKRAKRDGYDIKPAKKSRLVHALLKKRMPSPSSIIRQLRSGPAPLKKLYLPLRFIRDILVGKKEGMLRRSFFPINYKKRIVSMTIDPVSIVRAKDLKEKISYKRPNFWFSKPKITDKCSSIYTEIIHRIMLATRETYIFTGLQPSRTVESYLHEWLKESMILVGWYLKMLKKQQRKVPKQLWTNTGGYIWARILSRYVRENGGTVTRHTHAGGGGYFNDSWSQGVFEFEDCDTYVAFSEKHIASYQKAYTGEDVVQKKLPELIPLNRKKIKQENPVITPDRKHKKTIMYASTVYPGEFIYQAANGLMSDIVLLDWETRLASALQKMGYDVLLKPHPKDGLCVAPPNSINSLLGPVVINEPFENVMHLADVIIMDAPISSVFFASLRSGKPFVYMDFEIATFHDEAYDLLARRCPIVKGWYDSNNRADINWELLREAIEISDQYQDQSFAKNYLYH